MEAEIAQLATSGATALVGLMVTEAWTQARSRFAALLGRGRAETVEADLDETRVELVEAYEDGDDGAAAGARQEWQRRLRRVLKDDPQAVAELRAILAEFAPANPPAPGSVHVENVINGTVQGRSIQGMNVNYTEGRPYGR